MLWRVTAQREETQSNVQGRGEGGNSGERPSACATLDDWLDGVMDLFFLVGMSPQGVSFHLFGTHCKRRILKHWFIHGYVIETGSKAGALAVKSGERAGRWFFLQ